MNGDLEAVLVFIQQAFDFEVIILFEAVNSVFDVVPHFGFDLTATVSQGERNVGLA